MAFGNDSYTIDRDWKPPIDWTPDSSRTIYSRLDLPQFLPCPEGWTEVIDESTGVVMCDPYPEDGPMECDGIDEAHFPGETGCVRIGTECPEGNWAEYLPEDREVYYVKSGVDAGAI